MNPDDWEDALARSTEVAIDTGMTDESPARHVRQVPKVNIFIPAVLS